MKKGLLFFIILFLAGLVQFSCKKNGGSGPPTITSIRILDSSKRDSFFVEAVPGTEIVIQGNNLGGLQQAFFNDTSAYFNPVYNTNSTIIIVIPATAQTAATNPNVPSTLKLVTSHGSLVYPFKLYLPPPSISSIALNSTGTVVTIFGSNFEGIQKITFPVTGNDTALSYTVNKVYNQIVAQIPPGVPFNDSIRIYATWGVGSYPYPPPMTITSLSNENAIAGDSMWINGSNFVGVAHVTFPNGLDVTNINQISVNKLGIVVPSGITAPDSVRISGALGTATAPQPFDAYMTYPSPGYLCTFENQYNGDNTGFVGWTAGYASASSAATSYPGGTGACGVIIQASPMGANSSAGSQGNAGFLQLNSVPWVSNTGQSINNYSLKFEVYMIKPWSSGSIWIATGGWYGWSSYAAKWAPWADATQSTNGVYNPPGWTTVTIPLNQILNGNPFYNSSFNAAGAPAKVFTDYPSTALCFEVMNDQATATPANAIQMAVDNVRIVAGK